ncbi:MAG: phenylalanine--tRNA ligase subunit beta [Synechococcus sp.]
MRVSLSWLQDLVEVKEPADQLAERLSMAGFEVEAIDDLNRLAQGVVVGHVLEREKHPDADKLSVCRVDVGADAPLQIVCGASNVRAGIHVPVAMVGAVLPAVGLTIKSGQLRGVASEGMICSLAELGQPTDVDGIAILEDLLDDVPAPGTPAAPALGLDDTVLELAITANRPDGLSMTGIAREVSALTGANLQLPALTPPSTITTLETNPASAELMKAGGLYGMTEIRGVDPSKPSPTWLQRRLDRAGINSVNTVVDLTNLVMLEQGQPLHAFDADILDQLCGSAVTAQDFGLRSAKDGETFTGLDGRELTLDARAQLVTCRDLPIALSGVMGSAASGVTASTQRIWLESALFSPQSVRNTSRGAGCRTEASTRYEKGLPREVTLPAAQRAIDLIIDHLGGTAAETFVCAAPSQQPSAIVLRRAAVHQLLGPLASEHGPQDLDDAVIERCLTALGCALQPTEDGWDVTVPPSRSCDLIREIDLIEEVARLVGFDCFDSHLPDPLEPGQLTPIQRAERQLRNLFCASGLQEVTTLSLTASEPEAKPVGTDVGESRIAISNPLLAETSHLRASLWEEHLRIGQRNLQASQAGCWLFEMGNVFALDGEAITQSSRLGGMICGERRLERWTSSGKPVLPDYFTARGILSRIFKTLKLDVIDRPLTSDGRLHPGRSAELVLEGRPLGCFGQVHPLLCEQFDLPDQTYLFDLDLQRLLQAATRTNRWTPVFKAFATVPAMERDLAVVVSRCQRSADLLQAIRKAGKPLLESVELIDRFEGGQLSEDQCSQAFRIRYRGKDSTLTDDQLQPVHDKVRQALVKQFNAELRS